MIAAIAGLLAEHLQAAEPAAEAKGQARFLSRARQLTFEGRRSGEGYFSPDGQALVFQSERQEDNPFYQIHLLDLTRGDSHRVSPGLGKTTCAFFRPGTDQVLFASTHLDPEARAKQEAELAFRATGKSRRYSWDYDPMMDIFASHRDGSGLTRLTDAPGYDAEAAYSPDGSKIVFCSLRPAYPTHRLSAQKLKRLETDPAWFGDIYIMNADGSGVKRLTDTPGYDGGPFFSPDGQRIIWRRFTEDGLTADIHTMNLDGGGVRRLTDFNSMAWAPFYHPSGSYVIFTSNKHGFANFELFIVDVEGRHEPVRVTTADGFDGLPVFSPDGTQLCWTSNRTPEEHSQLFLAQWNHAAALAALGAAPERGTPVARAGPHAPFDSDIRQEDLRSMVEHLASKEMGGRMTGTEGGTRAADWLAAQCRALGLQPLPAQSSLFQTFSFRAGVELVPGGNSLQVLPEGGDPQAFEVTRDFRPLSLSDNATLEGEVVYAGYGLQLPGEPGEGYDSYAGLDVSNKIALVLRYVPEGVGPERRQALNRYAGLRYKALIARERGARAILFVTGPNSPNAGELIPVRFDSSLAGSGIVALTVSSNLVHSLLQGSGKDLATMQTALDKENPHAEGGFLLPKVRVRLAAALNQIRKEDRNVLAALPGTDPDAGWVMLGAHYDHLGLGESGAMGRQGEEDTIHPGADDNASGSALLLEVAAALSRERESHPDRRQRGVLFAWWSGEEIGLIGSTHFANDPPVPLSHIVAYLNFDMVGRLRENQLILQGVGSSSAWKKLIEKRNVAAGFNLVLQEDPYLPTDVTALYPKGVPVLNFFTGSHDDYHRPTDTSGTLNYEGLERISRMAWLMTRDLLTAEEERPAYVKVEQGRGGGSRDALRVYLGTVPDYAAEVKGVKLAGVRAGGPADKGGLKGEDVIVEFAGQKIANIYDYTYALDAVKIGEAIEVVVMRDGKSVRMTVVPEARK